MKLKKVAAEKSDHERKMKRKEKLEKCTNFFSSSLLESVYSKGKTISSDEQGKKSKGGEINSKAKNKETTSSSSRGDKNSKEKNKETNSSHGEKRKNNISSNTGNHKKKRE